MTFPAVPVYWLDTPVCGVALLADSVLWVIMADTLPVNAVVAFGTALYVATSVALIVITNIDYITSGLYDAAPASTTALVDNLIRPDERPS